MTLGNLQAENRRWAEDNFGGCRPASWPLLGAVEELGELAHAFLKREQGIRQHENHKAKEQDAVGDIIIYLADFCSIRGYSLEQVVAETWAKVKQRDWKKNPQTGQV